MPSHNCGECKTRCQRYTTDMPLCQWWQQCSLTWNHDYYASIKEYVVDQFTRSWHIHSSVPSSFLLKVSGLIFSPSLLHNFLLFKIIYSILILYVCIYLCHMCIEYWQSPEGRHQTPSSWRYRQLWAAWHWGQERNSGPLKYQQVLVNTSSFFHPPKICF